MIELFDRDYEHRISDILKDKVRQDMDRTGIIARGILEAIRLLEGNNVARSTKAMKHKERELKGELSGFYHIHVAEDHLSRVFNNIGANRQSPVKNPAPEEVICKATNALLQDYVKKYNIPHSSTDTDVLVEAIKNSDRAKKKGFDNLMSTIFSEIPVMVDRIYYSNNKVTGDWLIYAKHSDGLNYYLDHTVHIDPKNTQYQILYREYLNNSLKMLTK